MSRSILFSFNSVTIPISNDFTVSNLFVPYLVSNIVLRPLSFSRLACYLCVRLSNLMTSRVLHASPFFVAVDLKNFLSFYCNNGQVFPRFDCPWCG